MADDEARRKALDLEARVLQGLKSMENSLGLVQHKVHACVCVCILICLCVRNYTRGMQIRNMLSSKGI